MAVPHKKQSLVEVKLQSPMEELLNELRLLGEQSVRWRKTSAEGLDLDYAILFPKALASRILIELEKTLVYYTGHLAQVRIFGKWHPIPRQQVAFGDPGMSYRFSGKTLPAKDWPPLLLQMRDILKELTGVAYNFVLVNRYRDGNDCIGEHRDDEADLDRLAPIASVSLGAHRNFVLRHKDSRLKGPDKRVVPTVKLVLEHGSLLMMNAPTNRLWYHSVPRNKTCKAVRVNLTFRKMQPKHR